MLISDGAGLSFALQEKDRKKTFDVRGVVTPFPIVKKKFIQLILRLHCQWKTLLTGICLIFLVKETRNLLISFNSDYRFHYYQVDE